MDTTQPTVPHGYCQCGCGQKTRLAPRTDPRYGHIRGIPVRFLPGHQFRGERKSERYVVQDRGYATPCWIWALHLSTSGYGRVGRPGQRSTAMAHRDTWERLHGPVPAGLELDHLCRNRACINPAHLEVVTSAENTRRGINGKLTPAAAAEIRAIYAKGGITQRELAQRYGVAHTRIGDVVRGTAWTTDSQSQSS